MSLTCLIQMGTPGSRANFQKPAWLCTCTTRGDCMALLMRHCISILNSNCYISEHPLAGEKERENKILSKNIRDISPVQWGPQQCSCSLLSRAKTYLSSSSGNNGPEEPVYLDPPTFVAGKIVTISGFIFDKLQVLAQVYDGSHRGPPEKKEEAFHLPVQPEINCHSPSLRSCKATPHPAHCHPSPWSSLGIFQYPMLLVAQSLSHVWLFVTPWTAARQASLSFTISQSLPKLIHWIGYHPVLF